MKCGIKSEWGSSLRLTFIEFSQEPNVDLTLVPGIVDSRFTGFERPAYSDVFDGVFTSGCSIGFLARYESTSSSVTHSEEKSISIYLPFS